MNIGGNDAADTPVAMGTTAHLRSAEPAAALHHLLHEQQHGGAGHEGRGLAQPVPRGPGVERPSCARRPRGPRRLLRLRLHRSGLWGLYP